jgi:hypothetical protein
MGPKYMYPLNLESQRISGVLHLWYFIYGSNLHRERLEIRLKSLGTCYREKVNCVLEDYEFAYNKLSIDTSSKGNIFPKRGSKVYGIAIMLTESDFNSFIHKFEKGYEKHEVTILSTDERNPQRLQALTCISDMLTDARPSAEYVEIVVEGARQNNLPRVYIEEKLMDVRLCNSVNKSN